MRGRRAVGVLPQTWALYLFCSAHCVPGMKEATYGLTTFRSSSQSATTAPGRPSSVREENRPLSCRPVASSSGQFPVGSHGHHASAQSFQCRSASCTVQAPLVRLKKGDHQQTVAELRGARSTSTPRNESFATARMRVLCPRLRVRANAPSTVARSRELRSTRTTGRPRVGGSRSIESSEMASCAATIRCSSSSRGPELRGVLAAMSIWRSSNTSRRENQVA